MISSVVKNSWNWNFADFGVLVLILPVTATTSVFLKKPFLEIFQYSQQKKNLCQGLFLSYNFIEKKTLAQRFSCEFCKFLKTLFLQNSSGCLLLFYESSWLYTLQLYIAGNLQVQWNLSKVDTIGAKKFVRFRQMSAL